MLSDFIRNLLVTQVQCDPKALISQRFRHRLNVIGLCIGDIEHGNLHRSQPGRQCTGMLLDQNAKKTLQTTDDGAVQHHGAVASTVFPYELGIQTFNVNAVFGLADNFSEAL